uniref:Membrane anchored junction protein n=1 Tax=Jaculus jaculus TaxID=51337 RepID=A0A8C5LKL9_JACJA
MVLKPFTYPFPETRFFHIGLNVYKFKLRYGNSIRGEETENKEDIIRELEDSIRVVLANSDNLQPFVTQHFIVFPYKSKWERVSHLKFKHGEIILVPYPFVFTLYVEMKWFNDSFQPGKPVNNIPFELAKMETSSQGSSKKKAPLETMKKKKEEAQQGNQEIPTSETTDVQEKDSKQGHSLLEPVVPLPEKSKSPPPKKLGTSGFFGFLSTLFPFRYFYSKSSQ